MDFRIVAIQFTTDGTALSVEIGESNSATTMGVIKETFALASGVLTHEYVHRHHHIDGNTYIICDPNATGLLYVHIYGYLVPE